MRRLLRLRHPSQRKAGLKLRPPSSAGWVGRGGVSPLLWACGGTLHSVPSLEDRALCGLPNSTQPQALCSPQAFLSAVLSKLALLGSTVCFILSGVGLTNGPLCLYNDSEHGHGPTWGYPFLDTGGEVSDNRYRALIMQAVK